MELKPEALEAVIRQANERWMALVEAKDYEGAHAVYRNLQRLHACRSAETVARMERERDHATVARMEREAGL